MPVEKVKEEEDAVVAKIDIELFNILEKIKDYVQEISYGSMRPSTREASKLLAKKIIKKGGIV